MQPQEIELLSAK